MRGQERKRESEIESREAELQQRVPVSGPRDILTVYGKDPNFEYRFVNDQNNRIQRFLKGGWEIVTDDLEVGAPRVGVPESEGSPIKVSVGSNVQAYLMRIKKEYYDEDQQKKWSHIDEVEKAIMESTRQQGMYGEVKLHK